MGGSRIEFLLILANGSLGPDMKIYKNRKCGIFYILKIEKQVLPVTASVCLSALQKGSSVHGLVFFRSRYHSLPPWFPWALSCYMPVHRSRQISLALAAKSASPKSRMLSFGEQWNDHPQSGDQSCLVLKWLPRLCAILQESECVHATQQFCS